MNIIPTSIPEVLIIEPKVFKDHRGLFFEAWSQKEFDEKVRRIKFVQDNESLSRYGVIRGLHFQKGSCAQSKLVSVVSGSVLDVAVDIRRGSPTFGKHVAVELSGENHRHLFIPKGFAHGFSVLSESAAVRYKCDAYYSPAQEAGLAFNDPSLGIDWLIPEVSMILSSKDRSLPLLADAPELFDFSINYYTNS